jgi:hypothetical protein
MPSTVREDETKVSKGIATVVRMKGRMNPRII